MNITRFMSRPYREGDPDSDAGGGQSSDTGSAPVLTEMLPEDLRDNESLRNFKDVGSLAKSFLDMKSYQGNSIRIPSEDAGEDDRKAFIEKLVEKVPNVMLKPDFTEGNEQTEEFFRTLGKPSDPKDYTLPEIEDMEIPEDRAEILRKVAYQNHLTKDQFTGITQAVMEIDRQSIEEEQQQVQEDAKTLRQEWGAAFDERKNKVINAASHTGAPDRLIEAIKNDAAGVETMEWLYKVSQQIQGEGINVGNQASEGNSNVMTPAEAQARISEINNNRQHPYWQVSHPDHQKAVQEMVKLQKLSRP